MIPDFGKELVLVLSVLMLIGSNFLDCFVNIALFSFMSLFVFILLLCLLSCDHKFSCKTSGAPSFHEEEVH